MGILGYSDNVTSQDTFFYTSSNSVWHGIDWIYTFTESMYAYEFKILYFKFLNSIFDDSFDYYQNSLWYFSCSTSAFQLFWSVLLDNYTKINVVKFPFLDGWFKSFLGSTDASLAFVYHPELSIFKNKLLSDYYLNYFTDLNFSIYELIEQESFITPVLLLPQLLFMIYLAALFISFYFSFYTSSVKDESTIDADYLAATSTVEAEKELGSLDDMILGILVLAYIFGWYFYIQCWTLLSIAPEVIIVFYLFPCLYYIILSVPTYLSYDFGIFFLAYLRGVGPSPVLIAELMYDYIAFVAFYIRLFVQGVRLVLMTFTYISMHDLILFFSYDQKMMLGSESFWEDVSNLSVSAGSLSYFFLFSFPGWVLYWMYEIFHTFFVVTAQLIAFFAMVFWLFLFLYTFFVFEKIENFFKFKREERKKLFSDLLNLKK